MKLLKITFTLALLTIGLSGCGGGENLKDDDAVLTPVEGVVTLDGEPLANAGIRFIPIVGSDIQGAYFGSTDMTGKFQLQNARGRIGAEPGEYQVMISKFAQKDGTPLPPDADSGDIAALGMEHLPPNYSDPQKTEIRATVPPGGRTDFEFPLKSKK